MFDVVIKNGHLVDGTGNPWFEADVGIRSGRILAIGELGSEDAERNNKCRTVRGVSWIH